MLCHSHRRRKDRMTYFIVLCILDCAQDVVHCEKILLYKPLNYTSKLWQPAERITPWSQPEIQKIFLKFLQSVTEKNRGPLSLMVSSYPSHQSCGSSNWIIASILGNEGCWQASFHFWQFLLLKQTLAADYLILQFGLGCYPWRLQLPGNSKTLCAFMAIKTICVHCCLGIRFARGTSLRRRCTGPCWGSEAVICTVLRRHCYAAWLGRVLELPDARIILNWSDPVFGTG